MINPDDELFWHKVREAYDVVYSNKEQTATVTVGNREAEVNQRQKGNEDYISVHIFEVEIKKPTLIVP